MWQWEELELEITDEVASLQTAISSDFDHLTATVEAKLMVIPSRLSVTYLRQAAKDLPEDDPFVYDEQTAMEAAYDNREGEGWR